MKKIFPFARLLFFVTVIIGAGMAFYKTPGKSPKLIQQDIMSCEPASDGITVDDNGKFIPALPGWGHYNYTISTKNDSTQFYFNQGLSFYYSYHLREALASFKEAARFDPGSAMAYWGQALSMGPYFNVYYYKMKIGVLDVIKSMNSNLSTASEKEKGLIQSIQKRYSTDTTNADRRQLDSIYAASLSSLMKQYPDDIDIKALYIDAVMLEHKWNFWKNNGIPEPWTPELLKLCEAVTSTNPKHPAILHYYIHLVEASKHPELALKNADLLKNAMPGVGHMVHMATHMYQRNGLFAKGVFVNDDSNDAYNQTDSLAPMIGIGKNSILHIYAVQSFCAMNAGMYDKAMPVYKRVRNRVLDLRSSIENETYSQYAYMMPVIAMVRMGKWQQILQSPAPDDRWKYAIVLDNFAKGLAHVQNKNVKAAKECLRNLELNMKDSLLTVRLMPFNKPLQGANIASAILKGQLLFEERKTTAAIAAFKQAVKEEDNLIYCEPQDWLIPSRQYLGAYLLKMKKAKAAENVYREDLIANPGNGWSMIGMYKSLLAQKRKKEADKFKTGYEQAFKEADVQPLASVF